MQGSPIEVDGATHWTDEELARDAARTTALAAQGFAILRFTNDEVFHNLDGVLETVYLKLTELRPRIEDSATWAWRVSH
jgi:very-short-patch-repair endonuclease